MTCPLCGKVESALFSKDKAREYFRCPDCFLIFADPNKLLSPEEEKRRYDLHKNSPEDPRYRNFLNRLFLPLKARLESRSQGLDFGSGPGPTLSVMLEEAGHQVSLYDPFYAPHPEVFENHYDFITATEAFEHLRDPKKELDRLWSCLKKGGVLGIMTKLAMNEEAFSKWHYKNDPTHVSFFSRETFRWLARKWNAGVTFEGADVILIQKII
jgi:SAM-dependent methyltransferase